MLFATSLVALFLSLVTLPLVWLLGSEVAVYQALMIVLGISIVTCLTGYYTDEGV